jgi:hypothetical protein
MRHRTLLALAVLAIVGSLTACGGGVKSTLDPVAAAADKSATAGGFKVSINATFTGGGQTGGMTAEGVFDQDEGELTLDMSNLMQGATGAGSNARMKMIYLQEDGHTILYVNAPFLSKVLPNAPTWIKADLDKTAKMLGLSANDLLGQSAQNPSDTLDMLRTAGKVEKAGTDVIDGTNVTLYHATIDLVKAAELKGLPKEKLQELTASGVPREIPVDVWIGDDGLLRQLRMSFDATEGGQPVSMLMTMKLSDWGRDVSVEAPPADQVFDATELAANAGRS